MAEPCPHCGGLINGSDDQVARWRIDCKQGDLPIIGERVSETTAAVLLGVSAKWLSRKRKNRCGPQWSTIPVAGSRVSYTLHALAAFADAHTVGEVWE